MTTGSKPIVGELAGRSFTNELGNTVRIIIEGPHSISENELTRLEARELAIALLLEGNPHLEAVYERMRARGELGKSGIADRVLNEFHATDTLADELSIYADNLRTWTLADEEVGNVRPLRELLRDASRALTKATDTENSNA
jgi:hypothetical protein